MANTEGISDEDLAKLLTVNLDDHRHRQPTAAQQRDASHPKSEHNDSAIRTRTSKANMKIPRGMLERQIMMDEFDATGEINFQPSAKVIRSSNRNRVAPVVVKCSSSRGDKGGIHNNKKGDTGAPTRVTHDTSKFDGGEVIGGKGTVRFDDDAGQKKNHQNSVRDEEDQIAMSQDQVSAAPTPPPVLRSEGIQERKVRIRPTQNGQDGINSTIGDVKKVSRFKLRQQNQNQNGVMGENPTSKSTRTASSNAAISGFPSFDIPVGALTRKGKLNSNSNAKTSTTTRKAGKQSLFKSSLSSSTTNTSMPGANVQHKITKNGTNDENSEADQMLANMSQSEIQKSVAEIESMLSAETIQFLKSRRKSKNKVDVHGKSNDGDEQVGVEQVSNQKDQMVTKSVEKEKTSSPAMNNHTPLQDAKAMDAMVIAKVEEEEKVNELKNDHGNDLNESELESASKLLRSTAMRQRILGAKNMCELLDERVQQDLDNHRESREDSSEYPDLLPVALRCILDTPAPHKHPQLLSYTLRCVYNLLLLFVHPCHRVPLKSLSGRGDDVEIIYQQEFMQDAVLTSTASELYSKQKGVKLDAKSDLGEGCYATNASAESAASDAKSFYSDPAWILLSKMRIIPCLSHLLLSHARINRQSKEEFSTLLSVEAVTSICGILGMLSLRSPGAAVAIVQHKDLMSSLVSLTLEPGLGTNNSGFVVDPGLAFPVVYICCLISRQSRSAAKSLEPVVEQVVYITATDAAYDEEYRLQQWCIILWRTMLRYGIGLSYLSTILPLSVPRLASDSSDQSSGKSIDKFSLGPEYLSAYSAICECVIIATMHKGFRANPNETILSESDRETIVMSGMWLSSHARNCADDLVRDAGVGVGSDIALVRYFKQTSAKLRFLSSFFDASSPSDIMGTNPKSADIAFVPLISMETFLAVLNNIVDSQILAKALDTVVASGTSQNVLTREATACSVIESFFSCLRILSGKLDKIMDSREEGKVSSNMQIEIGLLLQSVFQISRNALDTLHLKPNHPDKLPRNNWINRAYCSIGLFLSSSYSSIMSDLDSSDAALPLIQSFVLQLLGKLQQGEESFAAQFFSQDIIFTCKSSEENYDLPDAFLVQDAMMRELCTTAKAQSQLDHSFKLRGRPGLTAAGIGHFALESLRSQSDYKHQKEKSEEGEIELNSLLLPMGPDWIWKLLSSTVVPNGNINGDESKEDLLRATMVLNTTMNFILYVEKTNLLFATMIPAGAKMYFLLNSCFNPELVISNVMFEILFLKVFMHYRRGFVADQYQSAKDFIAACYKHSIHVKRSSLDNAEDYNKMMDLFFNNAERTKDGLSSKHLKAIDDFIEDFTNSFIDFGAQYELFVHAVRILLLPGMPVRMRTRFLDNLKDLLHLLTTSNESPEGQSSGLRDVLSEYFMGGLPMIDGSPRDDGVFLDSLSTILKTCNFNLAERRDGFFYFYAIGCLSRNLASNAVRCDCGVKAMKRRLKGLDENIWADITMSAYECIGKKCGTSKELAAITIKACKQTPSLSMSMGNVNFDNTVDKLRQLNQDVGGSN